MDEFNFEYMFIFIFNTIFRIYCGFDRLIRKKYENTFVYDKELKCIFVRGYQDNNQFRIKIPHCEIEGIYTFKIDDIPIRCFIDGSLENSDSNTTYLLMSNNVVANKKTKIEVTDVILGTTITNEIEQSSPIDFNSLI
jgi:hypothetical protein